MQEALRQEALARQYETRGFAVIEGLLSPGQVAMAQKAMDVAARAGKLKPNKSVPGSLDEYAPVLGELFLENCRTRLEAITGNDLLRAYAFWRIYSQGASLVRHVDRRSCEVTVTVTIGKNPEGTAWPISLVDLSGEEVAVDLPPGTGIVFKGHLCKHWRDPLEGESHKQLFLHYVIKDGEYAEMAFDGRGYDPISGEPV